MKSKLSADETVEKQFKYEKLHNRFISNTNLKGIYYKLNNQVDLAIKATEKNLENKRNELKKKLLEDETCLTYEYVKKAQEYAAKLFHDKKTKAEQILFDHENERLKLVDEMLTKQKILNSERLRIKATKDRAILIQKINEMQIKDKERLAAKENENLLMYSTILNDMDRYNSDNAYLRQQYVGRLDTDRIIKAQMAAKELSENELEVLREEACKCRRKFEENQIKEDQLNTEREHNNKLELRKTLLGQIELNNKLLAKRQQWENEMDIIFINDLKREMIEELDAKHEGKLAVALELQDYAQSYKDIKAIQYRQNVKDNEILNNIAKEKQCEYFDSKIKDKHTRRNLAENSILYWGEQILDKKKREQHIKDTALSEKKIYETCNINLDEMSEAQKHEDNKKLENDLLQQIAYRNLIDKRKRLHNAKTESDLLLSAEANYEECIKFGSPRIKHPFYRALCS